jgi:hypothetical protein
MNKHITQKESGKEIAILSGTELLSAIEAEHSVRRRGRATEETVRNKLNELVLECLRCFSAALEPLGIHTGGDVSMFSDFSRDPQELYDTLDRMRIGVAVKPRVTKSSVRTDDLSS